MEENLVRFVSSKPYLNVSDDEFAKMFFCTKGRQEIVVLCSEELKEELKKIPANSVIAHTLTELKNYLAEKNIPFVEEYSSKNNLKL